MGRSADAASARRAQRVLALGLDVDRLRAGIAVMTAALGGLDTFVVEAREDLEIARGVRAALG
jgi:acetate kinase